MIYELVKQAVINKMLSRVTKYTKKLVGKRGLLLDTNKVGGTAHRSIFSRKTPKLDSLLGKDLASKVKNSAYTASVETTRLPGYLKNLPEEALKELSRFVRW